MAYIAPKAAHEPFNPAPWYEDAWDPTWPAHEPRPVAWNASFAARAGHASVIPHNDMLTEQAATLITDIFKNRWRTLMSVDDLIYDVVSLCDELGLSDNTYIFYSSDHGSCLRYSDCDWPCRFPIGGIQYYDGQTPRVHMVPDALSMIKLILIRDTHIHLLAKGPGITPGSTWNQPATQVKPESQEIQLTWNRLTWRLHLLGLPDSSVQVRVKC